MKIIFYTRFNRVPNDGWRVKKTIANPKWWQKRLTIMENTLVPSLKNQTNQNFEAWAIFTDQITDPFYLDAQKKIADMGFKIVIDKAPNETLEYIPYKALVGIEEDVVLVGIDSDDMVSMWLIQNIEEQRVWEDGNVFSFGDGHIVDYDTNKVYAFLAKGGHLPFVVYYIPKTCLEREIMVLTYLNQWKMNVHHYDINKAPKAIPVTIPWLMSTNGNNTSTRVGNIHVDKRLGEELTDEKKKLELFRLVGYRPDHG